MNLIDPYRCMAARDPVDLGGPRCQAEATHDSLFGRRCDRCAERLRAVMRDQATSANVMLGRARTEEEIARLVRVKA